MASNEPLKSYRRLRRSPRLFFPNWWIINYLFYKRGCQIRATWLALLSISLPFATRPSGDSNWSLAACVDADAPFPKPDIAQSQFANYQLKIQRLHLLPLQTHFHCLRPLTYKTTFTHIYLLTVFTSIILNNLRNILKTRSYRNHLFKEDPRYMIRKGDLVWKVKDEILR